MHYIRGVKREERKDRNRGEIVCLNAEEKDTCNRNARVHRYWEKEREKEKENKRGWKSKGQGQG